LIGEHKYNFKDLNSIVHNDNDDHNNVKFDIFKMS